MPRKSKKSVATETLHDIIAETEAGKQIIAEAQAQTESIDAKVSQLTQLVEFVFITHPEQTGKRWNIRKDILPRRRQFLRWVVEGKTRTSYDALASALKQATTGPAAYAEACKLLSVETW